MKKQTTRNTETLIIPALFPEMLEVGVACVVEFELLIDVSKAGDAPLTEVEIVGLPRARVDEDAVIVGVLEEGVFIVGNSLLDGGTSLVVIVAEVSLLVVMTSLLIAEDTLSLMMDELVIGKSDQIMEKEAATGEPLVMAASCRSKRL